MDQRTIIRIAAISGAVSVALGAFGAHGLDNLMQEGKIGPDDIDIFETAVRYQFYHTFALIGLAALGDHINARSKKYAALAFLTGIVIFSGSLYLLSLSEAFFGTRLSWLGAITPLGGLAFIAGWLFLFWGALKK
ncbi:MAG: DUF423 domain-containing protein [Chitinophagales bacterium]